MSRPAPVTNPEPLARLMVHPVWDNKFGFEVENFRLPRGWYYGYVQPSGSGINLENLGATPSATHADNVCRLSL